MQFVCQLLGPEQGHEALKRLAESEPEIRVDAKSYASAARVHMMCNGPRWALMGEDYEVRVRKIDPGKGWRRFKVRVTISTEEIT